MEDEQIAVYGGGGFTREVAWLISSSEEFAASDFVGYIDDAPDRQQTLNGKPVHPFADFVKLHPDARIAIGIGDPTTRRSIAEKCAQAGLSFATLWHKNVERSEFVEVGEGVIICAGSILTVNIELGAHVHVNLDCTIGHDVIIGDYSTLSPGVHVSGNVTIGKNVYIGTGANIINGTAEKPLVMGDGCVIAAGACVTGDTDPSTLYAGVPAKPKKVYG